MSWLQARHIHVELTATLPGRVQTELKPELSKARRKNPAPGAATQPQQAQQQSQAEQGRHSFIGDSTMSSFKVHHSEQKEATLRATPAAFGAPAPPTLQTLIREKVQHN